MSKQTHHDVNLTFFQQEVLTTCFIFILTFPSEETETGIFFIKLRCSIKFCSDEILEEIGKSL